MTEMDKLDAMLTERGIEHTYDRNYQDCGTQIIVYEHGERAWDAVCTRFSYGGKDGYLEVMAEASIANNHRAPMAAGAKIRAAASARARKKNNPKMEVLHNGERQNHC